MRASRRRWLVISVVTIIVIGIAAFLGLRYFQREQRRAELHAPPKPEAPPDLAKLRDQFTAALDAIRRNDAAAAQSRTNGGSESAASGA